VGVLETPCSPRAEARPKESAEKVVHNDKSIPQALKRGYILNDLAARVELVPFPRAFALEFFRSLLRRIHQDEACFACVFSLCLVGMRLIAGGAEVPAFPHGLAEAFALLGGHVAAAFAHAAAEVGASGTMTPPM